MRSKTPRRNDLEWWLGILDGVTKSGSSWKATCPAHDDRVQSLSISLAEDGVTPLLNCFAGCGYQDILDALNGTQEEVPKVNIKKVHISKKEDALDPKIWWEEYTGIPWEEWQDWGVIFQPGEVIFSWGDLPVHKKRKAGTKEFSWSPPGVATPPLWPYPEEVARRVFLCEGETDTGVLRHLGLQAYSITKGAQTPLLAALNSLRGRGVKEVISAFDVDSGGEQGLEKLTQECLEAGIILLPFPVHNLVDPLAGEKDLRDYWLRTRDIDTALTGILSLVPEPSTSKSPLSYASIDQFMATPIPEDTWLAKDVWLAGTIGMIAGAPKMYKSWLALDLGLSIASGTKFLGTFDVPDPGPVVIIPKEDPDFLLQDRIAKIMLSKGLGGILNLPHIQFPERGLPFYLDLTREFLFSEDYSFGLFEYLRSIADKHGDIRAVIFDPVLRMLLDVDEYKASEVSSSVFSIASKIQREFNAAVILIHHRSKGGADTGKRSYGSIAFHAFSESALYLKGEEPDPEGWVEVEGQYKSAQPTYWAYRFADLNTRYQPEVRQKEGNVTDLHARVLETLSKIDEGLTSEELLTAIPNSSDFLVRKILKQLVDEGEVDFVSEKRAGGGPGRKRWRVR